LKKVKLVAQLRTAIAAVVVIVTHKNGQIKGKPDVLFNKSLTRLILASFFLHPFSFVAQLEQNEKTFYLRAFCVS